MRTKVYSNNIIELFIVVFASLIGIFRCFKINNRYTLLLSCFLLIIWLIIKGYIQLSLLDLLVLSTLIMAFGHKYYLYSWWPCVYLMMAILSYFSFRRKDNIKTAMVVFSVFSVLNIVVTIINIVNPDYYFRLVSSLMTLGSLNNIENYLGLYLTGLSDHYSRNAYYCVLGSTIFFSLFFGNSKKKTAALIMGIIEVVMIMVIGKRGHFVFFLATLLFVYIQIQKSIGKKVLNLIRLSIVALLIFGILVEYVPAAMNVFNRFTIMRDSGDVTTGRSYLWNIAIEAFMKKPILGWGYGYFTSTVYTTNVNQAFAGVHNDYLQWLCEMGIIGFLINMGITIGIYLLSLKELNILVSSVKKIGSQRQVMIIWSVLFQTFVITYSLTGLPHFDYEINIVYYISLAVPMILLSEPECKNIDIWKGKLRWA